MKSHVLRCEKKLKDNFDDEIKLAGLEALVPEELKKHLTLNSNRCEHSRMRSMEIVTYVEAKFGLRILDSRPSDTVTRGHNDPMDFDTVNPCHPVKEKGHRVHETVASSAVERIFNVTAMHAEATASNHLARAKQSKSWSKSESKGHSTESNE